MLHMVKLLKAFGWDRRGNVAMIFGLSLPVVAGGLAAAVDMNTWYSAKTRLQLAVDGAVLTAARELQVASATPLQVTEAARTHLQAALAAKGPATTQVTATASIQARTIEVFAEAEVSPIMSRILFDGLHSISARAVAQLKGSAPLCVLGLDPNMAGTIHIEKDAQITANRCAVYSNSTSRAGLKGEDGAIGKAALFCSAGGSSIKKATFDPAPLPDCPAIKDPLAARPAPSVGGCIAVKKEIKHATVTLSPGTYCDGLKVTENSHVTLQPGIYVIKDGPLVVNKDSTLQGQNVAFYFMGDKASLLFDKKSTVRLTAPKDGQMAGFLMSEERAVSDPAPAPPPTDGLVGGVLGGVTTLVGSVVSLLPPLPVGAPKMREYHILSDNARNLLGTIYLPSGRLAIDSKKAVADQSAYTVIVVRRLDLFDGPNLILNSDYSSTDIPVPKGVGPSTTGVMLAQ